MSAPDEEQMPKWNAFYCYFKFAGSLLSGQNMDYVWTMWGRWISWIIIGLIIVSMAGAAAILAGATSESGWGKIFFNFLLAVMAAFAIGPYVFTIFDIVSRGREMYEKEWLEQQKKN